MNKEQCKYCVHEFWCTKDSENYIKCRLAFFDACNDFETADDQKAKADSGKPRLTLVPTQIIFDIAKVREYGNQKYPEGGPDNWKQVEKQRYRDAAFRHFIAYLQDPKGVDSESGISHLSHLACNIAFLCEMEKET